MPTLSATHNKTEGGAGVSQLHGAEVTPSVGGSNAAAKDIYFSKLNKTFLSLSTSKTLIDKTRREQIKLWLKLVKSRKDLVAKRRHEVRTKSQTRDNPTHIKAIDKKLNEIRNKIKEQARLTN